ncbi:hypothetical protein MTO96_014112 [Rhipicephalus appendiculatus]
MLSDHAVQIAVRSCGPVLLERTQRESEAFTNHAKQIRGAVAEKLNQTRPTLPAGKANAENVIKPDTLPVVRRLKVKTVTATTMEAEWINPNAHVRGYRVTCESGKSVHADFNTTRHSWNFADLTPGAEYVIRVQTIEPGGSAYGNAVSVSARTRALPTPVDSLEARFLNDTTLQVTWKTANAGAIYIRVCPVSPSERNCTVYTTNGDSLEYQIYNVGREPEYEVLASFSPLEEGLRCIDAESSVTVRRPPPAGGHNSGSSTGVCGLLMMALLLLPVLKSC